ncbi:MAG TPA: hypothetical protein VG052_06675 [Puia sp.]|jgi:hypothetical protein|nr:hypothetical protein [Puia sp.]
MSYSSIVGSVGVLLLLAAFFLHLFGFITQGRLYILLNILGAGLSCYASVLIRYWPFVVLEGCWVLVSIAGLREAGLRSARRKKKVPVE